jgi:hypothetical protein
MGLDLYIVRLAGYGLQTLLSQGIPLFRFVCSAIGEEGQGRLGERRVLLLHCRVLEGGSW